MTPLVFIPVPGVQKQTQYTNTNAQTTNICMAITNLYHVRVLNSQPPTQQP